MDAGYGQPIHSQACDSENNIEGLIQAGADVEALSSGKTPIVNAAAHTRPDSIRVLLAHGANVHVRSDLIDFALLYWDNMFAYKAAESVALLAEAGADFTDKTREKALKLCKDFDRCKDSYNHYKENKKQFEDAVDHMCKALGIERPGLKAHDGKSKIVVKATDWRDQHAELWEMLVPGQGKCKTVQGEVVRIGGRINDEIFNSGGSHWDKDFRAMLNALKGYYEMGTIPDEAEHEEALALIKSIGKNSDGSDVLRLCEINIHWVLANPDPIPLGEVKYKR
ncbi:MAG: hypothetical protein NC401_11745, partial [Ruminococcus sp.]|nr:hypothetical protein [Ruminococcus sp.]